MGTTPFRLVQSRLYAHLAECVKRDDNGRIHSERYINVNAGKLLRVPMYGYIRKCAICGLSRLIQAAWALIETGKLGYVCADCDSDLRQQSAVDTTRWL